MAYYWVLPSLTTIGTNGNFNILDKAHLTYFQFVSTLSSESIYSMLFTKGYPLQINLILPLTLVALLFSFFCRKDPGVQFARLCLLSSFGILIQICLTRSAGGPHHFLLTWPLIWLFLILLANYTHERYVSLKYPIRAIMLGFLLLNCVNSFHFLNQISKGDIWHPKWSPAIYLLIKHINDDPREHIFCLDWGMATQVKALANLSEGARVHDIWPIFWNDNNEIYDLKSAIESRSPDLSKAILIEFIPEHATKPQVHPNVTKLLSAYKEYAIKTQPVEINGYGYLVYKFSRM
jgi:hypothetical protein